MSSLKASKEHLELLCSLWHVQEGCVAGRASCSSLGTEHPFRVAIAVSWGVNPPGPDPLLGAHRPQTRGSAAQTGLLGVGPSVSQPAGPKPTWEVPSQPTGCPLGLPTLVHT